MKATRNDVDFCIGLFPYAALFPAPTPNLSLIVVILQLITDVQGTNCGTMHEVPEHKTVLCVNRDFL